MNTSNDSPIPDFSSHRFLIEDWDIEPELNRLTKDSQVIQLEPKVMQVLTCLVHAGGRVVSKADLLGQVWKDTVVSEEVVSRGISELRKVFKDSAKEQRVIETIRKKGYRLAVPVIPMSPRHSKMREVASDGMVASSFEEGKSLVMDLRVNPLPGNKEEDAPITDRRARQYGSLGALVFLAIVTGVVMYAIGPWDGLRLSNASMSAESEAMHATRVRPFTYERGVEESPRFSPDGGQVVYAASSAYGEPHDLYVKNTTNSESATRITMSREDEAFAAWAPASVGPIIVFSRESETSCEIRTLSLLNQTEQVVAECGAESDGMSWSPNGRYIVFAQNAKVDGPHWLTRVDLYTGEEMELTLLNEDMWGGDVHPRFSPDGSEVAFIRYIAKGIQEIFVVPTRGGEEKQVTFDRGSIVAMEWDSDGEHFIVSSDRDGVYGLWRINLDGEVVEWIAASGEQARRFDISAERSQLIFERWSESANIWACTPGRAGPCTPEMFLSSTRKDELPEVSPDGASIAFKTFRSGEAELWIADRDGANARPISQGIRPLYAPPAWSPDNQHIAFDSRISGNSDIYLVNIDTGQTHRFTMNESNDISPSWSPSGEWVYFGSDRGGCFNIWRKSIGDGTEEQVTSSGGHFSLASPDDRYLFYIKVGEDGLWRKELPDGEELLFVESFHYGDWTGWGVKDSLLYVMSRNWDGSKGCAGNCILFLDPETGSSQAQPVPIPGQADSWYRGLTILNDTTVVYGIAEEYTNDLMLIEW